MNFAVLCSGGYTSTKADRGKEDHTEFVVTKSLRDKNDDFLNRDMGQLRVQQDTDDSECYTEVRGYGVLNN